MSTSFKISIPKPCSENWDTMTPNQQGRFCKSCSKTVIDFTGKSISEIKNFLIQNNKKQICGRFTSDSLDDLIISIPEEVIQKAFTFKQLFLLALLITMGTTLFSCSDSNGTSKQISAVEIITNDTLQQKAVKADSIIKVCEEKQQIEQEDVSNMSKTKKDSLLIKAPPVPTMRTMGKPVVIMGGIDRNHVKVVPINPMPDSIPYISESDFKEKLMLVSSRKALPEDFAVYLGGDLDMPIIVNKKGTTFLEFCEKIKGKEINFKEIEILRGDQNIIKNIIISYKKMSIF